MQEPACADPYEVSASALEAVHPSRHGKSLERPTGGIAEDPEYASGVELQILEARDMTVEGREFTVAADVGELLDEHGPGVYTIVLLWQPWKAGGNGTSTRSLNIRCSTKWTRPAATKERVAWNQSDR